MGPAWCALVRVDVVPQHGLDPLTCRRVMHAGRPPVLRVGAERHLARGLVDVGAVGELGLDLVGPSHADTSGRPGSLPAPEPTQAADPDPHGPGHAQPTGRRTGPLPQTFVRRAVRGWDDVYVDEHLLVRRAEPADLPAVAAIFAHYVERTVATFETDPPGIGAWRQRFADLTAAGWPFLVGAVGDQVISYGYVGPWRDKPAYRHTVEDSVYIQPGHTGRGHGRLLLSRLLPAAAAAGAAQVIAVIADSGNPAPVAVHRAVGFTHAGRLRAVGRKHGRWIDVNLLQRSLDSAGS